MKTKNNSDLLHMRQVIAKLQQGNLTENEEAHTDHEVSMASSQLLSSVKSATRIAKHIKDLPETEGLEAWVASKLTLAEEYLQTVADHMDGEKLHEGYKVMPPMDKKYQPRPGLEGPFTTLSGKVVYYDPKEGKYYDSDTDMYMSYDEFQKHDTDYSGMKDERDEVKEAGGYYTQPVYDMIKQHGYPKVMHRLLTALHADIIQDFLKGETDLNEAEKRWKQTSMSPEEAIEKYGKENVKVKKGALRNGDDMVEVFVESYSPGDEYADSEGMVSNCCGAPMMDYNDGFGRCSDCKEMASGESEEEYYEATEGSNAMNTLRKIVADKQNMPVKFDDGSMKVDLFSASAITQVYDAVKPETREKMDKLLKTKAGMMKVQAFSMKAFESEEFQGNQIKESSCDCCDSDPCDCGPDCGCGCNSVKESKEMMTEAQFDEAAGEKDACYRKVKSRYKVWPSAYASGALVKCRKVGASNWGNSKK